MEPLAETKKVQEEQGLGEDESCATERCPARLFGEGSDV